MAQSSSLLQYYRSMSSLAKDVVYEFQKDFNDKELHKGGEKGLKDAENVMLMRAGSLELKNF